MTVEKPKPKQLLRPITTGTKSAMNQSQFLAITCYSLEAREKSRVHGAIGFGFASHWLKNWRDSFKPMTKRSNRNHVITFDTHLKTAPFTVDHITAQLRDNYASSDQSAHRREYTYEQLITYKNLTLKMTSEEVVKTSVTNNSSSPQNSTQPDD